MFVVILVGEQGCGLLVEGFDWLVDQLDCGELVIMMSVDVYRLFDQFKWQILFGDVCCEFCYCYLFCIMVMEGDFVVGFVYVEKGLVDV